VRGATITALLLALLGASGTVHAAARFAVVVGSNEGAPSRARLWFAERDAERVARALVELGEFAPDAVRLLQAVRAEDVRAALAATEIRLRDARAAGEPTFLLVFFSGHASPTGLELGSDRLGFDELRGLMTGSAADARVVIVDACEAGTLTQVKGARPAAGVDFALPRDDDPRGVAYIASTAVGEPAQESAALGGSFFTVHLETALRGPADADGDGRVTLGEAFRYTSTRTVVGTTATDTGPQHPTFDIRMSGRGDVVLTDLRRAAAKLVLPGTASASYRVSTRGGLVAEAPGGSKLALPEGHYLVETGRGAQRLTAELDLARGEERGVPALTPAGLSPTRAKGGELRRFALFTGPSIGLGTVPGTDWNAGWRIGGTVRLGPVDVRVRGDWLQAHGNDLGLRYTFNSWGGGLAVLYPLFDGQFHLSAGLDVGYAWNTQALDDGRSFAAGEFAAGPTLHLGVTLGPVLLGLQAGGSARVFKLDGALTAKGRADGCLYLGVAL